MLIDKILAFAPEDLASIITLDNIHPLIGASGIYAYKLQGLWPTPQASPLSIIDLLPAELLAPPSLSAPEAQHDEQALSGQDSEESV